MPTGGVGGVRVSLKIHGAETERRAITSLLLEESQQGYYNIPHWGSTSKKRHKQMQNRT